MQTFSLVLREIPRQCSEPDTCLEANSAQRSARNPHAHGSSRPVVGIELPLDQDRPERRPRPLHITVVRCALGAAVLLALARSARQRLPRSRRTWAHLVVAAFFCNVLPFFLFGVGEQTVDSGVAGVLNATTPLWSMGIGLALGSERGRHPLRLTGLLLGFAGVLLVFAPWQESGLTSWGALLLLAAAVSYAVAFAYMARHLLGRDGAPLALSASQLIAATGLTTLALPAGPGVGAPPSVRCSPSSPWASSARVSPSTSTRGSSRTRAPRPRPPSGICCRSSRWPWAPWSSGSS